MNFYPAGTPQHFCPNVHHTCKSCDTVNHESRKQCIGCGAEM